MLDNHHIHADSEIIRPQNAQEICSTLWGPGVSSTNRLDLLLSLTAFDPKVFWDVFHRIWDTCDNTWPLQCELIEYLEEHRQLISMDGEQTTFLSSLEIDKRSMVTVYRGCSRSRIRAVSWTSDLEVAKGFARGHRGLSVPDPVLVKAKIRKSDIFTVILTRGESEIVLQPHALRYLREISQTYSDKDLLRLRS